jgi:signal peptidase I
VLALVCTLAARFWLGALWVGAVLVTLMYVACSVDAYRSAVTIARSSAGAWIFFGLAMCGSWFVAPIVLALVLRWGAIEAYAVPSKGMCPTIEADDRFFVDKTAYRFRSPARGEIVMYERTERGDRYDYVFRVVGIEGDDVELVGGKLTLNGKPVPTTALAERACDGMPVAEEELGSTHRITLEVDTPTRNYRGRVPEGTVFVLGDNRFNAVDSRASGPVPISAVRGHVWRMWSRGSRLVWQPVE